MKITNEKDYDKIPDGDMLHIFFSGTGWDNEFGKSYKVVKIKDKIYKVTDYFNKEECFDEDDPSLEVVLAYDADYL